MKASTHELYVAGYPARAWREELVRHRGEIPMILGCGVLLFPLYALAVSDVLDTFGRLRHDPQVTTWVSKIWIGLQLAFASLISLLLTGSVLVFVASLAYRFAALIRAL